MALTPEEILQMDKITGWNKSGKNPQSSQQSQAAQPDILTQLAGEGASPVNTSNVNQPTPSKGYVSPGSQNTQAPTDPLSSAIRTGLQGVISPIPGVSGEILNNMVKPTASFAAGVLPTAGKIIQGGVRAIGDLPSAIAQGGLQNPDKPLNLPTSIQDIQKTAAEPVNLPWLGNVNMVAPKTRPSLDKIFNGADVPDEVVGMDPGQTMKNIIGKGLQTAATVGSFGAPSLLSSAVIGAAGAGGATAQEKNSDAGQIILATLLGGGTGAALHGLLGKILPGSKSAIDMTEKEIENAGNKIGLPQHATETLKTMTPEEKALQSKWILQAAAKAKNPDEVLSPMEDLASKFTNGMRKLFDIKQETGAAIGATKEGIQAGSDVAVNPDRLTQVKTDFMNSLGKIRANIPMDDSEGLIDFSKSTIKNNPGDQKMLQSAFDEIKNAKTLDDLISARDTISNTLSHGRANQQIGSSEKYVSDLMYGSKNSPGIAGIIHETNPELGKLDSTFHDLTKATQAFQHETGGKLALTADQAIDGTNTFNLLRKSLGGGQMQYQKVIQKLQDLGDEYGIPELQNIMKQRRFAQTAEDVIDLDSQVRPTSIRGRFTGALKAGRGLIKFNPFDVAEGAKAAAENAVPASKAYQKLLSTQKGPIESLGLKPKALQFLKLLTPGIGTGVGQTANSLLSPNNIDQTTGTVSGLAGGILGHLPFAGNNQ